MEAHRLELEFERLQLEKREQATQSGSEKLARGKASDAHCDTCHHALRRSGRCHRGGFG
jgi:cell division protein FtsL